MWAEKHVHAPFLLGKQKYLLCFFLVSSFFKIQFLRCFETRCYKKQSKLILFLLEQVSCKFVSFYHSSLFFLFLFWCHYLAFFFLSCWKFVCSFFFQLRNLLTFSLCSFFFSFCFYFCSLVSFLCFLFSFHSAV
jgi:hypothetical protein